MAHAHVVPTEMIHVHVVPFKMILAHVVPINTPKFTVLLTGSF
jgi:hypothetical protein